MKKLLYLLPLVFFGCTKTIYVPINTETIRTETVIVHDTILEAILDPSLDSIVTKDTLSIIERKTAITTAKVANGLLFHTLEVKAVPIKIAFKYITKEKHDTTTKTIVQPLSKSDQNKLNNYDSLKEKSKRQTKTAWKLIGLLSLSVVLLFRKPIFAVIKKIIRPI